MAEQDCNTDVVKSEVTAPRLRHLTVAYASTYPDYQRIPALNIKGKWLEAAGFATGTQVDIRVMKGCLVITARDPEPQESALMTSLRKVCTLSARKQRQVEEFIGVITAKRVRR